MATKQDLKILETNLLNAIEVRASHFEIKVNNLENKLGSKIEQSENKMQQLEYRLIIKLGTLLIIGFTSVATLMKFWLVR